MKKIEKMFIQYGTKNIEFCVEYRKRKTLGIEIEPPDKIKVVAPKGISKKKIKEVVKSKGKWIVQKLYALKDIEFRLYKREFVNGESFLFLGRNYSLQINLEKSLKTPKVKLYQGKFIIDTPLKDEEKMRSAMEQWYRRKCLKKIMERIKYYKDKTGKPPRSVKVKKQEKRWGSCSSKGDLYFNWKAIMAPSNILDYIVVHELSHLVHFRHDNKFWKLVEKVLPDFELRKNWLKKHGIKMSL